LAPSQTAEEADVSIDLDLHDAPAPLKKIDEAWRHAKANPSLLGYKLQSNAYKFSWALIPICVPLVWLLFINRRRYRANYGAYEHTVFVTYALAFMSLAAIALTLLKLTGSGARQRSFLCCTRWFTLFGTCEVPIAFRFSAPFGGQRYLSPCPSWQGYCSSCSC
jgi:hypothetical protein